ncbi:hypothetical protein BGZ80_002841 [Entomortierella chlamydospora]|uniref:CCD97-like C-terminal domain-containing protein n=1 Tax=Entomortierella chlamydospora TaxID=101097 RepID=A0A9P6MP05_9FUNG|nr:hypothetical protein BGZ79_004659 [Entomortierella chlamydospora]KAG0009003.1 hypothetical protein BGZ80_002841 [Entomortierella chlamydospora]
MSLTRASIDSILQYLEPYLDTLQTGFPTSTRPNEPVLTVAQKRQKIEATLAKDPGIFLTKWGSVILYPRPVSPTEAQNGNYANGGPAPDSAKKILSARDVLDLFTPLASDYEVRYQLTKLYQQLQQLFEHDNFEARSLTPAMVSNDMEIEDSKEASKENQKPDKPEPDQSDLFARSIVSQSTRRNRRLNYLLRHLAPPSPSDLASASTPIPGSTGPRVTSRSGAGDGSSGGKNSSSSHGQDSQQHPTLASILSISGSMSNLSFSESTYFSDAEMEARAPKLYHQYIGRFMEGDDREDDDSSDTVESDGTEDGDSNKNNVRGVALDDNADDEGDGNRVRRLRKTSPKPFGKDVSLVDRILWSVDHPTRSRQRQEETNEVLGSQQRQRGGNHSQSNTGPAPSLARRNPEPEKQDSESEFEEEFDTESEVDDSEMAEESSMQLDSRKGPLKDIISNDDEIRAKISVTPPIPPDPIPGVISSTFASAAMTLEQPEERNMFASVNNGGDLDSDEDKELDRATANRKEDQEALRREFVLLMKQRFLDGLDRNFDYSVVDFDDSLDDLEQENHDGEDKWFDSEEEEVVGGSVPNRSSRVEQTTRARSNVSSKTAFDERVQAWENGAQNGSGEYDY